MAETKAQLLSLQQLRCFDAAHRLGSFTAAAELLDVSQPAVAEQIRVLERTLGVPLFRRLARGVASTSAGEAFAVHAEAALNQVDAAVRSVADVASGQTGTLAFGLFALPVAYRIDELVASFAADHPGLTIRLVGRNSSDAADRVRSGELEAALVALPIDDSRLDVRPLLRDEVVYVSADPARTRRPVSVRDLATRPTIFYDVGVGDTDPTRRQLFDRAQEAGLRISPRIEVETLVMALRLVADGLGDTYLPSAHTRAWHFPAGLVTTSFDPQLFDTLALVTRSGGEVSASMHRFLERVETHFAVVAQELAARRT